MSDKLSTADLLKSLGLSPDIYSEDTSSTIIKILSRIGKAMRDLIIGQKNHCLKTALEDQFQLNVNQSEETTHSFSRRLGLRYIYIFYEKFFLIIIFYL